MIKFDNEPKPVSPRDEEVLEKYEREFYEPINKELTLKFRNTGNIGKVATGVLAYHLPLTITQICRVKLWKIPTFLLEKILV